MNARKLIEEERQDKTDLGFVCYHIGTRVTIFSHEINAGIRK